MPEGNELAKTSVPEIVSEWVSFRVNPRPRNIEGGVKIGTDVVGGEVVHSSKYIGTFYYGKQGFVFPYSYIVERELEKMEGKDSNGPWPLPVFVREARNAYQAYAIDDKKLDLQRGRTFDEDKIMALEARVFMMNKMYQRLTKSVTPERIVICIDYQYFSKSIREEEKTASIEDLIELICQWGAVRRREETVRGKKRVYIVDFYNPQFSDLYEIWKNRGYQLVQKDTYRAPPENGAIINPTDSVIIETSLKELNELGNEVDVFCLVSGDKHFHNLIREIREKGKKVIIASFKRNTNRDIYVAANYFIDLSLHLGSP